MNAFRQCEKEGELGTWQTIDQGFSDITGEKYENLNSPYLLLQRIWIEADSKTKSNKRNSPPPPSQSTSNQTQETHHCAECNKNFTGEYWYHLTKNDNLKFCSQNCFQLFYAPLCNKCFKKAPIHRLDEQQMIWCYPCLKERLNEKESRFQQEKEETLARLKKAEEENKKGWEKTLKEVQENIQKQIEEAQKDDQLEVSDNNHKNSNINKDNLNMNTAEREREREREREQNPSKTNYALWIGLGLGGLALVGILVCFLVRKKGEKE